MEKKYYLVERGYGKFKYYRIKMASGKKLERLKNSGAKLFDVRREAEEFAFRKKNQN